MREQKKFHERFDIDVGIPEAKRRFVNRVLNFFQQYFDDRYVDKDALLRNVADALGEPTPDGLDARIPFSVLKKYINADFHRALQLLEVLYGKACSSNERVAVDMFSEKLLKDSEIDLGVRWKDGIFIRTGAALLDTALVNEPLKWLSESKFKAVRAPFEKGLSHYLAASKNPALLSDVITDMYESLEALAQTISNRPTKDLSANAEIFIKNTKASDSYKKILKEYIEYANKFRHAGVKPAISEPEAESFIYLTGLFIRMAIRKV